MPDLIELIIKWWKQILALTVIAAIVAAVVTFTTSKEYLGTSTAIPAPTYATDKAFVFSQQLQILYPGTGTADDLDMILGSAHNDTPYIAVAKSLDLVSYYGVDKNDPEALQKAASILKGKTKVQKSDYSELKVKVWDGNKEKAADMSNELMHQLDGLQQGVITASNKIILESIKKSYTDKQKEFQLLHDSLSKMDITGAAAQLMTARKTALLQQVQEYEKLLNEYQLMVNANPPALIITEKATPSLWPDKPQPKKIIPAAALLGFFFGLLLALVLERRKSKV